MHKLSLAAAINATRSVKLRAFANGAGVPADPAWAARWYAKAARQGHPEALYAYGVVLAAGQGLPADQAAGYGWLLIAARGGHGAAADLAPLVAAGLGAAEIAAAEAGFFPDIDPAVLTRTIAFYQTLGCWSPEPEIARPAFEVTLDVFLHAGLITRRHAYDDIVAPPT